MAINDGRAARPGFARDDARQAASGSVPATEPAGEMFPFWAVLTLLLVRAHPPGVPRQGRTRRAAGRGRLNRKNAPRVCSCRFASRDNGS